MRDFPNRIDVITSQLVAAAETDGFFVLVDHEIPASDIETQFQASERFFSLPDEVKLSVPFSKNNAGYEKNSQIRPSTGKPDRKESYQMQFGSHMDSLWLPESAIPGFKAQSLSFMHRCQSLSEKLMTCFARGLGFEDDYFVKAHDVSRPNIQTVLRAIHYFEVEPPTPEGYYRAGEHADWDFVTLLFQRPGQSGLEICPGREMFTQYGIGDEWTKVDPVLGEIVCNM
jgi:isopenicillin N synthase-like dioxygenase